MNKIVYWMVTLLIIFVAVLSPAKGKTVDGVVNPSTTLTIKSLIEAEYGEKTVVCPPAVHKNIKRLTPCAMGYRAIVGHNRVIITHMWPATTVDQFHKRAKVEPLEKEGSDKATGVVSRTPATPATEVTPPVVDETKALLEAQVKKLEIENQSLASQLTEAKEKTAQAEKVVETVKTESQEFAQTVASLKEEKERLQTEIERLNSVVAAAAANLAEKEEISPTLTIGQWLLVTISIVLAVILVIILVVIRKRFSKKELWYSGRHDQLIAEKFALFEAVQGKNSELERFREENDRLKKQVVAQGPPRPPTS